MKKILALLSIYGFRRIFFSSIGVIAMWIAVQILGSTPPAFWSEWPPRASLALSNLVAGSLAIAFCGWVFFLLKPIMSRGNFIGYVSRFAFGFTLFGGIGGLWQCLVGGFYLLTGEQGCVSPVLGEWMRVVGWPLLIGILPILLLEIFEHLKINPQLRRWFVSGEGHAATWIRPVEIKQFSKPLSRSPKTGSGHIEGGF